MCASSTSEIDYDTQKFDLSVTHVEDLEFEAYFELTVQTDTLCHVS